MKIETILTIIALVFFAIAVIFGIRILFASAEQYTFNYTAELEHEQKVVDICIYTSIKLDFCDTRYGGIETTYGEKIE